MQAPKRTSVVHLRAVPPQPDRDTVQCLDWLLTEARSGRLIGVAVGGILRGHRYVLNVVGEARNDPVTARGIVALLADELSRLALD